MKQYKTEIIINAAPSKVWETLMNHEKYSTWNPFVKNITGIPAPEEQLTIEIQLRGMKAMEIKPTVLVNKPEREFRWLGSMGVKGIFDGEHYFILESLGTYKTKLIHGEIFRGILAGLILNMIGAKTLEGFKAMNEALKRQVEQTQKNHFS